MHKNNTFAFRQLFSFLIYTAALLQFLPATLRA